MFFWGFFPSTRIMCTSSFKLLATAATTALTLLGPLNKPLFQSNCTLNHGTHVTRDSSKSKFLYGLNKITSRSTRIIAGYLLRGLLSWHLSAGINPKGLTGTDSNYT